MVIILKTGRSYVDGSCLELVFTVCGYGSHFLHCVDDVAVAAVRRVAVVLTMCVWQWY